MMGAMSDDTRRTTWHYEHDTRPKRGYLTEALCRRIIADPLRTEVQADGRIRFWGEVTLPSEAGPRILRVVTLADGETIHTAFIDRGFRRTDAR